MRLGLSIASYRWQVYPELLRIRSAYCAPVHPAALSHSKSYDVPVDEGGLEWLIDHCSELGLSALYMYSPKLVNRSYSASVRERACKNGIELILSSHFDWISHGPEAKKEVEQFSTSVKTACDMGIKIVTVTNSNPRTRNRFIKDPPFKNQLEYMKSNFTKVGRVAEAKGINAAFENHTDYRCSDICRVLRSIGNPSLKVTFDTVNSINVFEDPVAAAGIAAPYVSAVHLKDYRVANFSMVDGTPSFYHAPIGEGNVDLSGILETLQNHAPDPENLPLCIESVPSPEVNPDEWIKRSINNIQVLFGKYLVH